MENKLITLLGIIVVFGLLCLGWFGNDTYRSMMHKKQFDGLRFEYNNSQSLAIQKANSMDRGDWVCVNVIGMEYSRAVEICNHEVGHEIFAMECEKNITKCINSVKNEKN